MRRIHPAPVIFGAPAARYRGVVPSMVVCATSSQATVPRLPGSSQQKIPKKKKKDDVASFRVWPMSGMREVLGQMLTSRKGG